MRRGLCVERDQCAGILHDALRAARERGTRLSHVAALLAANGDSTEESSSYKQLLKAQFLGLRISQSFENCVIKFRRLASASEGAFAARVKSVARPFLPDAVADAVSFAAPPLLEVHTFFLLLLLLQRKYSLDDEQRCSSGRDALIEFTLNQGAATVDRL